MQLDVGSEPYLLTAQALCQFISHPSYYKLFANWQRVTAITKFQIHSYNTFRDMNYYPVTDRRTDRQTDRQTEGDAYEPPAQYAQVGSKIENP